MHGGFNLRFLKENFELFFSPAYCHWHISFDAAHLYCLVGSACHPLAYTEGLPRLLCPIELCPLCACIAPSFTKFQSQGMKGPPCSIMTLPLLFNVQTLLI